MTEPIFQLTAGDLAAILGPILGAGALGLRIGVKTLVRSIDQRFQNLSDGLDRVNQRCAQNHPARPENSVPPVGNGHAADALDFIDDLLGG